jgi:hypothetical protein
VLQVGVEFIKVIYIVVYGKFLLILSVNVVINVGQGFEKHRRNIRNNFVFLSLTSYRLSLRASFNTTEFYIVIFVVQQ